jgi:hypothetical protein
MNCYSLELFEQTIESTFMVKDKFPAGEMCCVSIHVALVG